MFGKGDDFFVQDPRASFYVGIAAGVGVISVIGFIILLVNFFGDGSSGTRTAGTGGTHTPTNTGTTPTPTPIAPVDIEISDGDYIKGNENAKITIVEFSDFQCPFCQRFHPTVQQALDEYGDEVRWVYKHFPLDSIHPQARPAAVAAECAGEQGKFWEYGDQLFVNQSRLSDSYFKELAGTIGLNTSQFNNCYDSGKYADKVDADYQLGLALGVRGTPTSFINGIEINGAQPYESVSAAIESLR